MSTPLAILNDKIENLVVARERALSEKQRWIAEIENTKSNAMANESDISSLNELLALTNNQALFEELSVYLNGCEKRRADLKKTLLLWEKNLRCAEDKLDAVDKRLESWYTLRNTWKDSIGATHR